MIVKNRNLQVRQTSRPSCHAALWVILVGWLAMAHSSFAGCIGNPMMQGQDPAVTIKDGAYHLVQSDGCAIHLRRSPSLGGLVTATDTVIYSPGCSEVWAPELHWLDNRWYLYLSRNPGTGHRGYVAESQGTNPNGPYTSRGILFNNFWNIDGSVFRAANGQLYYICSGNEGTTQNLYIAPMSNPYTLSGPLVLLSEPTEPWERIGTPKVNEGPWAFQRNGRLFIVYSASGCWTDDYTLGLLTFTGVDLLDRTHWTKTGPVFTKQPGAYGPGHNSVVQDVAGQWWNVYHANNNPGEGCGGLRRIRAQRFHWDLASYPDFGTPVPIGSLVNDDPDFLAARFPLAEASGGIAASTVCGRVGTLRGGAAWTQPGLRFNGTTAYLDGGAGLGNDVQHSLTLAAWIRPESFIDWAGIITKGSNASPYAIQTWNDGSLRFSANWGNPAGGIGSGSWNSTAKMKTGQWYHVAATYDGSRVRFYLNGFLDPNQPVATLRFGVVNEPLFLGADFPGGDEFFQGTLIDARVYGRALSATEIASLANRPPVLAPIDDIVMGAGQRLSITNAATDPDPGQTLAFDLLSAPSGAALNTTNGVFTWRPAIDQASSTNPVTLRVRDDGLPSLAATQSFSILVTNLTNPQVSSSLTSTGRLQLLVTGDQGPDYSIQVSTNLANEQNWITLLKTNSPLLPFVYYDLLPLNQGTRFYRAKCE